MIRNGNSLGPVVVDSCGPPGQKIAISGNQMFVRFHTGPAYPHSSTGTGFSLTYTPKLLPSLTLTAPPYGKGVNLQRCSSEVISWTTVGDVDLVDIYYYDPAHPPVLIVSGYANTGSYLWSIPCNLVPFSLFLLPFSLLFLFFVSHFSILLLDCDHQLQHCFAMEQPHPAGLVEHLLWRRRCLQREHDSEGHLRSYLLRPLRKRLPSLAKQPDPGRKYGFPFCLAFFGAPVSNQLFFFSLFTQLLGLSSGLFWA